MKIKSLSALNDFLAAVSDCTGAVWLESPEGDRYNLKSTFNQYIAMGKLLEDRGDYLELFCSEKKDEVRFLKFFKDHPEVNC